MPHLTSLIAVGGPILDFRIGVSAPRASRLKKENKVVPPSIPIRGLIDTGASCTCIDPSCLSTLGLSPTGQVPIHTPTTGSSPQLRNQYDISLTLVHPDITRTIRAIPVVESQLSFQGIHALIGRDVLKNCLFVYDGVQETFSLAF